MVSRARLTPRLRARERSSLRTPGRSVSMSPTRMVRMPWPGMPGRERTMPTRTRMTPASSWGSQTRDGPRPAGPAADGRPRSSRREYARRKTWPSRDSRHTSPRTRRGGCRPPLRPDRPGELEHPGDWSNQRRPDRRRFSGRAGHLLDSDPTPLRPRSRARGAWRHPCLVHRRRPDPPSTLSRPRAILAEVHPGGRVCWLSIQLSSASGQ
jgi:hypothetical protein